jgi:hypothetical protein
MKLQFDFDSVDTVEFGVGREVHGAQTFVAVSVDVDVQIVLREMAEATWEAMQQHAEAPELYDPSEKHAGIEHL